MTYWWNEKAWFFYPKSWDRKTKPWEEVIS